MNLRFLLVSALLTATPTASLAQEMATNMPTYVVIGWTDTDLRLTSPR